LNQKALAASLCVVSSCRAVQHRLGISEVNKKSNFSSALYVVILSHDSAIRDYIGTYKLKCEVRWAPGGETLERAI